MTTVRRLRTLDRHFRDQTARPGGVIGSMTVGNPAGEVGGYVPESRPWMRATSSAERDRAPFLVRYHSLADERFSVRIGRVVPTMFYTHYAATAVDLVRWLRDTKEWIVIDALAERPVCSQCDTALADPPSTMCRDCRIDVASGARA